jgi:hypothetical protein
MALASITLTTGATLDGRALARTGAVTLDGNTVNGTSGGTTAVGPEGGTESFTLSQNYPNPFNPSTTIRYSIEKASQVSLRIFNLLGSEVATLVDGRQEAGAYDVRILAGDGGLTLASGMYLYRLETGSTISIRKMILMK